MAKRPIRDRYEPLETVASGPGGEVVRALDREHNRPVALKIRNVRSPQHQDALAAETRMLMDLRTHANLPPVRDGFFVGDRHHLVTDWVEGASLHTLLEEQGDPGLRFSSVIAHLRDVASALDHLHGHFPPVVHGDVRPANILVTPGGRAVLVGIGMDRWQEPARAPEPYRAPEIAAGSTPTTAADVFGLAATAYGLLSGSPPGTGAPLSGLPRAAVGVVERTLARALEFDPSRRQSTALELVERLASWLDTALPTGIVTFLLSDIEGSTRLWENARDAMSHALARHDEMIDDAVQRHGGILLKTRGEGDATFCVFERPGAAVRCAAELQRAFADEPWSTPEPIRVRMALHTGEAEVRERDYYGPVVNRAARIRALAAGGQVLVSDATRELTRDHLPDGVSLQALGTKDLKDMARGEEVFLLVWESLAAKPAKAGAIPSAPVPAPAARAHRPARPARGRRWLVPLVAVIGALAIAAGAVAFLGGSADVAGDVATGGVPSCPGGGAVIGGTPIPVVYGLDAGKAEKILVKAGFEVNWLYVYDTQTPEGAVIETVPEGGSPAAEGARVDMRIAVPYQADLVVEIDGPDAGRVGTPMTLTVELFNLGPDRGNYPGYSLTLSATRYTIREVTYGGRKANCSRDPGYVHCSILDDFPVNGAARITVEVVPRRAGELVVSAALEESIPDPEPGNNAAEKRIAITA